MPTTTGNLHREWSTMKSVESRGMLNCWKILFIFARIHAPRISIFAISQFIFLTETGIIGNTLTFNRCFVSLRLVMIWIFVRFELTIMRSGDSRRLQWSKVEKHTVARSTDGMSNICLRFHKANSPIEDERQIHVAHISPSAETSGFRAGERKKFIHERIYNRRSASHALVPLSRMAKSFTFIHRFRSKTA